ncbi:unnamed protein product [Amoebophrya sp. A25]|nr:unnamed protein product [Amoebophrya sp. A25]|eukprot:GSA25T00014997001.1
MKIYSKINTKIRLLRLKIIKISMMKVIRLKHHKIPRPRILMTEGTDYKDETTTVARV